MVLANPIDVLLDSDIRTMLNGFKPATPKSLA
jgi:hypothetical protein